MQQEKIEVCPLCKGKALEKVIDKEVILIGLDVNIMQTYCICKKCQFVFTQNPLTEKELEVYYNKSPQERCSQAGEYELEHMRMQLAFLRSVYEISGKNILEVGANNGSFLKLCLENGPKKAFFLEVNRESAQMLRKEAGLRDFMALTESKRRNSLDLIILLHTLEHIVNPKAHIEYLGKYLNSGGGFFIEVPDFTFINEDTDDLFVEHVNYFTNRQLEQMFDDCGYDVISSQITLNKEYPACPRYITRIVAVRRLAVRTTLKMRIEALQKNDDKMGRILIELNRTLAKLGNRARVGIYSASWLTNECLMNSNLKELEIVGIFDRDPKKWKNTMEKISVYPPERIADIKMDYLLILNEGYEKEICDDLEIMGFPSEKIVKWSTAVSQKSCETCYE